MNKEQIIEILRKKYPTSIEFAGEVADEILALSKDTPYVGKLDNSKPTYQERRLKNV